VGIHLERLLDASRLAERLVGHPLPSQLSKAGPRWAGWPQEARGVAGEANP
jgi:hypothetical protein